MKNETCLALSIRQPMLWAILYAGRPLVNKLQPTTHRGRLLLHAPRTWDERGYEWLAEHDYEPPCREALQLEGMLGALVGEVLLTGCRPVERPEFDQNIWAQGPWCWILEHPVPYPRPIAYKGRQGLFSVTLETLNVERVGGAR